MNDDAEEEEIPGGYVPPPIDIRGIDYEMERARIWLELEQPKPRKDRKRRTPPPSN